MSVEEGGMLIQKRLGVSICCREKHGGLTGTIEGT